MNIRQHRSIVGHKTEPTTSETSPPSAGHAVQVPAWMQGIPLQPKLTVNQPGDLYEQEADAMAEQVMRMPVGSTGKRVQRCACGGAAGPDGECEVCKARRLALQRKGDAMGGCEAPQSVHQTLNRPGQPLDDSTRDFMESRFGSDFSGVRVHTDSQSAQSAGDVSARAYTVGQDVVFGAGQYTPGTEGGKSLLAHELTHVVQQDTMTRRILQRDARSRHVVINLTYSEDSAEFYRRLAGAISKAAGISESGLWQPLHSEAHQLHSQLRGDLTLRSGTIVRITVDVSADSNRVPAVTFIQLSRESGGAHGSPPAAQNQTTSPAVLPPSEVPQPNETPQQTMARQARTIIRLFSDILSDADQSGYSGVRFTIKNDGNELIPGMQKLGEPGLRPAGTTFISPSSAQQEIRPFIEMISLSGEGAWTIDFARDERGTLRLMRTGTIVQAPVQTASPADVAPGETQGETTMAPDEAEAVIEDIRRTRRQLLNTAVELIQEQNPANPSNIVWSVTPFALGRLAKLRNLARLGGIARMVGRTGASVFGEVRFTGLIRNRRLRDLTHNEIYTAFKNTTFRPSNHAIMRLKHERTEALGMTTLADVEQLLNRGIIQESRGVASIQGKSLEAIVNPETGIIVTISPL